LEVPLSIHREGYPFIAIFAAVNLLAFLFAAWAGWLLLPITIWCIAFFRDPERNTPTAPGLIVSPADGKLLPIVEAAPPPELGLGDAPRVRLSIFMNVFNVHVNRNPLSGTVIGLAYRPGKFFNASFDKASVHNERMAVRLRPDGGSANADLVVVQIAGLVARRIVCDLAQGELVQRGQRFGMIRFGSRLDVYLPPGARVVAAPGMKTVAGETVLAEMDAPQ
jgi:phosphatidylserine decarboxylase